MQFQYISRVLSQSVVENEFYNIPVLICSLPGTMKTKRRCLPETMKTKRSSHLYRLLHEVIEAIAISWLTVVTGAVSDNYDGEQDCHLFLERIIPEVLL